MSVDEKKIKRAAVQYTREKLSDELCLEPECVNESDSYIQRFCGQDIEKAFIDGIHYILDEIEFQKYVEWQKITMS